MFAGFCVRILTHFAMVFPAERRMFPSLSTLSRFNPTTLGGEDNLAGDESDKDNHNPIEEEGTLVAKGSVEVKVEVNKEAVG